MTKKADGPVTLYHPTLRDAETDVSADTADEWVEQGWRKTKPALDDAE